MSEQYSDSDYPTIESDQVRTEEQFIKAAEDASQLQEKSRERSGIDFGIRRDRINNLIDQIPETVRSDTEAYQSLKDAVRELLVTDPLTDQEAGIIARWEWYLNHPSDIRHPYYDLTEDDQKLTLEEIIELRVGDWKTIQSMAKMDRRRKEAWEVAVNEANSSDKVLKVYRGMILTEDEIRRIRKYGIVPAGLMNYGRLNRIIDKHLWIRIRESLNPSYWDKFREENKRSNAKFLPLSKCALLTNHWAREGGFTDDFGSTLESLAISTAPEENKPLSNRYGSYVITIQLPAQRLVRRWREPGMTDYSVLFYIEPEAIEGIEKTR